MKRLKVLKELNFRLEIINKYMDLYKENEEKHQYYKGAKEHIEYAINLLK